MSNRASILFVDDEQRVLNSMRGMFRRDFDLHLATEGSSAVQIAAENAVDVVVADQRMPGMTGIEVLSKIKELSPNTIRILLTGYADPTAVEGSINDSEVFRFLGKPCAPKLLRETLNLAVKASRAKPAAPKNRAVQIPASEIPLLNPDKPAAAFPQTTSLPDVRASKLSARSSANTSAKLRRTTSQKDIGVVVYTVDAGFAETAVRALAPVRSTALATSLFKVMNAVERENTGVLITDITSDGPRLQNIVGALKQFLPELVTVVVSDSRDTNDMIGLINYGQVYRYIVKPVTGDQLCNYISSAASKHLSLCAEPHTVRRHTVDQLPVQPESFRSLNHVLSRIRQRPTRSYVE